MLRDFFTQDLYIALILLSLIVIVVVKQLFSIRFNDFLSIVWNDRYLKLYNRERKKIDLFNLLLFINFVIMTGVFSLILYKVFNTAFLDDNILTLLLLFGCIAGIVFLKYLIERFVANTFEFSGTIKNYAFYKITHKNLSGLTLLCINISLLFSQLQQEIVIYVAIGIFLLINISGFIRFIKVYQKPIVDHIFYFLLYLCALEIGPYVILYKVFKDNFV